jgi:hypothetical protein
MAAATWPVGNGHRSEEVPGLRAQGRERLAQPGGGACLVVPGIAPSGSAVGRQQVARIAGTAVYAAGTKTEAERMRGRCGMRMEACGMRMEDAAACAWNTLRHAYGSLRHAHGSHGGRQCNAGLHSSP